MTRRALCPRCASLSGLCVRYAGSARPHLLGVVAGGLAAVPPAVAPPVGVRPVVGGGGNFPDSSAERGQERATTRLARLPRTPTWLRRSLGCYRRTPGQANAVPRRLVAAARLPNGRKNHLLPAVSARRRGWSAQSRGQRSGSVRRPPPCGRRLQAPLLAPGLRPAPQTRILQNPSHRVRCHQRHPIVAFGQFVRNASLPPTRMLTPQLDHLRFNRSRRPMGRFGRMTPALLQRRIPTPCKTRLPVVKGALTDVCLPTGFFNIARLFPRRKEKPPLRRRSRPIIRPLLVHTCPSYLTCPKPKNAPSR